MLKSKKGFTGIDMVLTVIIAVIFTSIIVSLMHNVKTENQKIKLKALSNIYLIETMENIGIASYDDVTSTGENIFPEALSNSKIFDKNIEVISVNSDDASKQDIIKKIKIIIRYKIDNKTYEQSAERLKIKE